MRFILSDGIEFEIPDAWWQESRFAGFRPGTPAYLPGPHSGHPEYPVLTVPITDIDPIHRDAGVVLNFRKTLNLLANAKESEFEMRGIKSADIPRTKPCHG